VVRNTVSVEKESPRDTTWVSAQNIGATESQGTLDEQGTCLKTIISNFRINRQHIRFYSSILVGVRIFMFWLLLFSCSQLKTDALVAILLDEKKSWESTIVPVFHEILTQQEKYTVKFSFGCCGAELSTPKVRCKYATERKRLLTNCSGGGGVGRRRQGQRPPRLLNNNDWSLLFLFREPR
jgi:hypothetical protein